MYLAIVAVVGALAAWRLTQSRQRRRAKAAAATQRCPSRSAPSCALFAGSAGPPPCGPWAGTF